MSLGLAYYILLLLWLVYGCYTNWANRPVVGGNVIAFLLFLLVGWKVFGPPIHG